MDLGSDERHDQLGPTDYKMGTALEASRDPVVDLSISAACPKDVDIVVVHAAG